jgi:hypothetical protein
LYQRNTAYVYFNPAAAISNDSATMAKTFLFPEISRRLFVIGYERKFPLTRNKNLDRTTSENQQITWSLFGEFSTSHFDTGSHGFYAFNAMAGPKLTLQGSYAGFPFGLQIIPYYSLTAVEQKYWIAMDRSLVNPNFDELTNYKGVPPTVHAAGINIKGSISSFEVFANYKYILNNDLNNNPNIHNPDLKTTVLTIGVNITPEIWSFSIPQQDIKRK